MERAAGWKPTPKLPLRGKCYYHNSVRTEFTAPADTAGRSIRYSKGMNPGFSRPSGSYRRFKEEKRSHWSPKCCLHCSLVNSM